jgi:hypothetical protein
MNEIENIPFDEMCKKYVHPGVLLQDPGIVMTKEGSELYSFPLFTPLFCETLIKTAEQANKYGDDRHEYYPTTDVLINDIGYGKFYKDVLKTYVHPLCCYVWRIDKGPDKLISEDFLIRYTPDTQAGLRVHNDFSLFTVCVTLNRDFKGGGTAFPRQNVKWIGEVGSAVIHPGRLTHPHGGIPITEGKRFINVSFCWDDVMDNSHFAERQ